MQNRLGIQRKREIFYEGSKKVSVIMALIMLFGVAVPVSSAINPSASIKVSAATSKKPKLNMTKYKMALKQKVTLKVKNTKK